MKVAPSTAATQNDENDVSVPSAEVTNQADVALQAGMNGHLTPSGVAATELWEAPDHSHAAFVADERLALENAYFSRGQGWLEGEYGQPVTLEAGRGWRTPVRKDKRDYRAEFYTDDKGRPRFKIVIHNYKTSENILWDDYGEVFEVHYREWLERKRALTAEEREAYEARQAERRAEARRAAEARVEAERIAKELVQDDQQRKEANLAADRESWGELPEEGQSSYLRAKGLPHATPFRYQGQTLVVPMWSVNGEFAGTQRLGSGGLKLFTDGARKKGAFAVLGGAPKLEGRPDLHDLPRFIAEGAATAMRPYQAYDEPVLVAFDAGNIGEVIRAICGALDAAGMEKEREAWLKRLVIVADNDAWKIAQRHNGVALGNVGLEAAHRVALEFGCRVAYPDFSGLSVRDKPTDFDDLARLAGLAAVKAQLEQAALAKPNLALARERRAYLKELTERGATFERYLKLGELPDGPTVIQSPQNTGKTEMLKPLIDHYIAEGKRVLYISHRIALAADAAKRLRLDLYSQYTASMLRSSKAVSISTNSLHLLDDEHFDIVVIDESDQALPSFTGSHMKNKLANLGVLERLVKHARKVVCLDANAGTFTRWALEKWRAGESINWLHNHWDVGAGRTVDIYPRLAQLYPKLGPGTFVATDAIGESRRLAFTLIAQGVKTQLINGETSHDLENLEFIANINERVPKVGAISASPSMSTGVSITSPHLARTVGAFHGGNGPATEALQAMWRARASTDWHVWLQATSYGGDSIDLEARYGVTLDAELERSGNPAHLARGNDHGYAALKRLVDERNQWARRTFSHDFVWQLVVQGFDVRLVDTPTEAERPALQAVLEEAREREKAAYADERFTAECYDLTTAKRLRELGTLTSRERYGLERYDHTDYFRTADEPDLLTWLRADYRGRYRRAMGRLELVVQNDEVARSHAQELLEHIEVREDAKLTLVQREFNQRLLAVVELEQAVDTLHDELEPADIEAAAQEELQGRAFGRKNGQRPSEGPLRELAVERFRRYSVNSENVRGFITWIEDNRAVLAGVVGLPASEVLTMNAVRYIASWLKPLGLRQHRAGKNERREYCLDAAALALAAQVFKRREQEHLLRSSAPPAQAQSETIPYSKVLDQPFPGEIPTGGPSGYLGSGTQHIPAHHEQHPEFDEERSKVAYMDNTQLHPSPDSALPAAVMQEHTDPIHILPTADELPFDNDPETFVRSTLRWMRRLAERPSPELVFETALLVLVSTFEEFVQVALYDELRSKFYPGYEILGHYAQCDESFELLAEIEDTMRCNALAYYGWARDRTQHGTRNRDFEVWLEAAQQVLAGYSDKTWRRAA